MFILRLNHFYFNWKEGFRRRGNCDSVNLNLPKETNFLTQMVQEKSEIEDSEIVNRLIKN